MTQTIDKSGFEQAIVMMTSSRSYYSYTYIYYSYMISQCRIVFDPELGGENPVATDLSYKHDHFNLYINPTVFNELPIEQRIGQLKHEMLHILYNHVGRIEDRDKNKFDKASDCAINQQIEEDHRDPNATLPHNINFQKPAPDNLATEQYYTFLEDNDDDDNDNEDGQSSPLGGHSKWEESEGDATIQKDISKRMMEKSAAETQKSRGELPSQYGDWLDILGRSKEVDWKQVLRRVTGNKRVGIRKTLVRPDRRNPELEWLKGRTKDRKFELLVVSDVSASVSDEALLQTWSSVREICDVTQSNVSLIQVDAKAYPPEELSHNTKTLSRKASGGTTLNPALDMAKEHKIPYDAIVVTTDGYLSSTDIAKFRETKKKVIWLIEPNGQIMDDMNEGNMIAIKLKGQL